MFIFEAFVLSKHFSGCIWSSKCLLKFNTEFPQFHSYKYQRMTKEALDKLECDKLIKLCHEVKNECGICMKQAKFTLDSSQTHSSNILFNLHHHLKESHELLDKTEFTRQLSDVYVFAGNYDFRDIRANGFRSFLSLVSTCLIKILVHLRKLDRQSFNLWPESTEESLIAYLRCLEELAHCIMLICEFPKFSYFNGHLFPNLKYASLPILPPSRDEAPGIHLLADSVKDLYNIPINGPSKQSYNDLVDAFDLIQQDAFYGRTIGFYYNCSAQRFFIMLSSIMAGFADSYQGSKAGLSGLVNTIYRTVTSFLSPEDRGRRIAEITRHADVKFCKQFWSLAENRLVINVPNLLLPTMAISRIFTLPSKPIQLMIESNSTGQPHLTTINPPRVHKSASPVSIRLLSKKYRKGMEWVLKQKEHSLSRPTIISSSSAALDMTNEALKKNTAGDDDNDLEEPLASRLLLHIHGGGFVALTAETHDIYIRPWAEQLDCPIVSVNYSLAPEAPYPRALDECFYAFCWVMTNRTRLGVRADARVVICGDSAGGNLAMGVCLRAASLGLVEMPAGCMIAYAPMLIAYVPSPSRMLSVCDPLLPIGIVSRCMIAYAGIDEAAYLASLEKSEKKYGQSQPEEPKPSPSEGIFTQLWKSIFNSSPSVPAPLPPNPPSLHRLRTLTRRITVPTNLCDGEISFNARKRSISSSDSVSSSIASSAYQQSTTNDVHFSVSGDGLADTLYQVDPQLQKIRACPIPQDGFLSPYLASDKLISRLPPLGIIACHMDPFLDDLLELAKRADRLSVPVDLHVFDKLPHAFLNFAFVSQEFSKATTQCCDVILDLMKGRVKVRPR